MGPTSGEVCTKAMKVTVASGSRSGILTVALAAIVVVVVPVEDSAPQPERRACASLINVVTLAVSPASMLDLASSSLALASWTAASHVCAKVGAAITVTIKIITIEMIDRLSVDKWNIGVSLTVDYR